MTAVDREGQTRSSKPERGAARAAAVAACHEAELGKLIERLRAELARYEAGELDLFEFDGWDWPSPAPWCARSTASRASRIAGSGRVGG